jgi:arylsulfatase
MDRDNFNNDRWELYHIDTDFSEAHDLATTYPDKLKHLQKVFETEARKNHIYPLLVVDVKDQPWPAAGRREFVYYPGLPRTGSAFVVPDFLQSHRILADVIIPETGADGVIITAGSRSSGFALYVKDGRLVYENHSLGAGDVVITSAAPLPHGEMTLAYEFTLDGSGAAIGATPVGQNGYPTTPGVGRLYVNGQVVGEARQGPVISWIPDYGLADGGTFGVGQAFGSPVSTSFQPPFKFTGTLIKVTVNLR